MEEQNQQTTNQETPTFNFGDYKSEFLGKVPEDQRESYSNVLNNVKDLDGVLNGYVHAQKQFGKAIFLPENEEGWDKVYSKLGRPAKPEEYDLNFEGYELNEDIVKTAKQKAFELGLSGKQAREYVKTFVDVSKSEQELAVQAQTDAQKAYDEYRKTKYADKLEETENLAASFLEDNFEGDALEDIKKIAGTNQHIFDLIAKMAEGGTPKDGANLGTGTGYKSAAEQIEDLNRDKEFFKAYNSGDPQAKQKWNKLQELKQQELQK